MSLFDSLTLTSKEAVLDFERDVDRNAMNKYLGGKSTEPEIDMEASKLRLVRRILELERLNREMRAKLRMKK